MPDQVVEHATRRLRDAAAAWKAARDDERTRWHELIRAMAQADDAGIPRTQITAIAGVARQTVYNVLDTARHGEDIARHEGSERT